MASLKYDKRYDSWRVVVFLGRDERRRIRTKTTSFRTEAAAREFMADNGLVVGRRGGRGRGPRTVTEVIQHLADNSAYDPESGCVVWQATLSNEGYGAFNWKCGDRVIYTAHRISYHVLNGTVTPGLVVDHLCRNRACIRPDHLDLVTQRENVLRSPIAPGAINAAKTHCPQGHEYTPENTYIQLPRPGRMATGRLCKTCTASRSRRSRKAVSA